MLISEFEPALQLGSEGVPDYEASARLKSESVPASTVFPLTQTQYNMLKAPGTQVKLTNVSIVRLKKAGKRFEVSTSHCHPSQARLRSPPRLAG